MALSTVQNLKTLLSITSSASDAALLLCLNAAQQIAQTYMRRTIESATYTEYYDGNGQDALYLRQNPVTTLTSVAVDAQGFYGKGPNSPFPSTSLWTDGTEFVLTLEGSGTAQRGKLMCLRGRGGSGMSVLGDAGWGPFGGWRDGGRGTLTPYGGPAWPGGLGNIKVVYVAGYATVPDDIIQAVNALAIWGYKSVPLGGVLPSSESLGAYSYSLGASMTDALDSLPGMGSVRQILNAYRRKAI